MKVLALILSGCKSESSPEQNFPLLRTLKLQLNFQRAKQKQQKKDQMFLIYEQKWIRQWSTVSCCLTPWITLSGRRDASRVFPRPASNPPLPPSLNASRAAETCSNPQIFNGRLQKFPQIPTMSGWIMGTRAGVYSFVFRFANMPRPKAEVMLSKRSSLSRRTRRQTKLSQSTWNFPKSVCKPFGFFSHS